MSNSNTDSAHCQAYRADAPSFVPARLRSRCQWVPYRVEQRGDKTCKVPFSLSGWKASVNRPSDWGSFGEAVARLGGPEGYGGVGYVITTRDGLVFVDLDHCADPDTGHIEPWAVEIINDLNSYAEFSPSGTGVHVFVEATLPPAGRRKGHIELYDRARFATVTGRRLPGFPDDVQPRQRQIRELHRRCFGEADPDATPPSSLSNPPGRRIIADNDELIACACAANDGGLFSDLWNGRWQGRYGSQSEADLALMRKLAFWTGCDAFRMELIFGMSNLGRRDKWTGRTAYRRRTVNLALSGFGGGAC